MTDEIIECRDPNGVPFAETNNYADRRWAMKTIADKDARIAELEAENKTLRKALKPFADAADDVPPVTDAIGGGLCSVVMQRNHYFDARAALNGEK